MPKKVIQVPVDEDLLESLDRLSKKQSRARADLIRVACLAYLEQIKKQEMEAMYEHGYAAFPETRDMGEAQVKLLSEVVPPGSGRWNAEKSGGRICLRPFEGAL